MTFVCVGLLGRLVWGWAIAFSYWVGVIMGLTSSYWVGVIMGLASSYWIGLIMGQVSAFLVRVGIGGLVEW